MLRPSSGIQHKAGAAMAWFVNAVHMIADAAGNLFGTTIQCGASGAGTVFMLSDTGFVPGAATDVPGPLSVVLFGAGLLALVMATRTSFRSSPKPRTI